MRQPTNIIIVNSMITFLGKLGNVLLKHARLIMLVAGVACLNIAAYFLYTGGWGLGLLFGMMGSGGLLVLGVFQLGVMCLSETYDTVASNPPPPRPRSWPTPGEYTR